MVSIYALLDPTTSEIKYVGKSENPKKRFQYHVGNFGNTQVGKWVNELKQKSELPLLIVLDEVNYDEWEFWERYWIAQSKAWGFKLLNVSIGGRGTVGLVHSNETKRKIGDSSIKMWQRPEIKNNFIEKVSGTNNAMSDKTVYSFYHYEHGVVNCTQSELRKKYNLQSSKMTLLINGKRLEHGGWRLSKNIGKQSNMTDNELHTWIHDLHGVRVCRKYDMLTEFPNLLQCGLSRLKDGVIKSHKGWKIDSKDTGKEWVNRIQIVKP